MKINKHFYTSRKFLGFVLSFDFDVPQRFIRTYFVITVKLFFVGFWIEFNKSNK
jgi:hypothetical protein